MKTIQRISLVLASVTLLGTTFISRANVVVASFTVSISNDSGMYGYAYTITLADAGESLQHLLLDAERDGAAGSPSRWNGSAYNWRASFGWYSHGSHYVRPFADNRASRNDADLLPGQTLSGFSVTSAFPPRIQTAYARGFGPWPTFHEDAPRDPAVPVCWSNNFCDAVKLQTLSPKNPGSLIGLTQLLATDLDTAFLTLHWITSKPAYSGLKRINEQLQDALQKNNRAASKRLSESLADEAQRLFPKSINQSAKDLVVLDAMYVNARL